VRHPSRMRSAGILLCDRVRMSNEPTARPVRPAQERKGADYAGAVYGSLLAASVVAGTSPRKSAPSPTELILLLLATGIVFWLTHVFAQLFGDRMEGTALTLMEFRAVATREAPIIQAAAPPALAAGIGALLGFSDSAATWLALLVAVAGQVGWALFAAAKTGATRRALIVSGAANLVLGLLIVGLKSALTH
jgi:hypothetical protein